MHMLNGEPIKIGEERHPQPTHEQCLLKAMIKDLFFYLLTNLMEQLLHFSRDFICA